MTVHPYRIATALVGVVLALSAVGGVALEGSANAAQPTRTELVQQRRADALRAAGFALAPRFSESSSALSLGRPVHSSIAPQRMLRDPLQWTPDSASTQWSTSSTSTPEAPNGIIEGMSCLSADRCEAVGSYQNDLDDGLVLAEVWNGTTWTTQPVPKPAGSTSSELLGVSCTAADACLAVGDYGLSNGALKPFAELWNGASWTVQLPLNPADSAGASLTAVSCTVTACEAVGFYNTENGGQLGLIERRKGASWTIQASPDPSTTSGVQLDGVSCNATFCEAVGSYGMGFNTAPLAELWNGVAWSVQTIPEPSDSNDEDAVLESVSCVLSLTIDDCEAVGNYSDATGFQVPLAEVWNGIAWAVQPAPSPAASTGLSLQVVSCVSKDACAAVGDEDYGEESNTAGVAEVWNGTDWVLQSTPDPDGSDFTVLGTVACPVAGFCEAAGTYVNSSGDQTVLTERAVGGGWVAQTAPSGEGNFGAELAGLSCVKRGTCEAVGDYYANDSGFSGNAWAERWSGGSWKPQTAPNPVGSSNSDLQAISCRSAGRCEAVGGYFNNAEDGLTLAELWNGHRWTVQRTPNQRGSLASALEGVSCSSGSDCEAVGQGGTINPLVLAEHWNGRRWDLQKTAKIGGIAGELMAVSCVSSRTCEAVGIRFPNEKSSQMLAERWNGRKWTLQRVPKPRAARNAFLDGVSCTRWDFCEAAGTEETTEGVQPVAEMWDGHKWSLQHPTAPGSASDISEFEAVSCTAKNSCEAAGYHISSNSFDQYTLVEAWNGRRWRRQSSASPGNDGFAASVGVSCTSKKLCRMVGYYDTSAPSLFEQSATAPLVETFRG